MLCPVELQAPTHLPHVLAFLLRLGRLRNSCGKLREPYIQFNDLILQIAPFVQFVWEFPQTVQEPYIHFNDLILRIAPFVQFVWEFPQTVQTVHKPFHKPCASCGKIHKPYKPLRGGNFKKPLGVRFVRFVDFPTQCARFVERFVDGLYGLWEFPHEIKSGVSSSCTFHVKPLPHQFQPFQN